MDYRAIADNSAVLMAITPAMFGVFSLAWTVLRKTWRVFALGCVAFIVPFCLFLAAEAMAIVKASAALPLFLSGCLTLGVAVIGYASFLVVMWQRKENSKSSDFYFGEDLERRQRLCKRKRKSSR